MDLVTALDALFLETPARNSGSICAGHKKQTSVPRFNPLMYVVNTSNVHRHQAYCLRILQALFMKKTNHSNSKLVSCSIMYRNDVPLFRYLYSGNSVTSFLSASPSYRTIHSTLRLVYSSGRIVNLDNLSCIDNTNEGEILYCYEN